MDGHYLDILDSVGLLVLKMKNNSRQEQGIASTR
jgi:hypothetical protein